MDSAAATPSLLDYSGHRNKINSVPRGASDQRWRPLWAGAPQGWKAVSQREILGRDPFDTSRPERRKGGGPASPRKSATWKSASAPQLPPAPGARASSPGSDAGSLAGDSLRQRSVDSMHSRGSLSRKWQGPRPEAYSPGRISNVPPPVPDPPLGCPSLGRAEAIHTLAVRRLLPSRLKGIPFASQTEHEGALLGDFVERHFQHSPSPWAGWAAATTKGGILSAATMQNLRRDLQAAQTATAAMASMSQTALPRSLVGARSKDWAATWSSTGELAATTGPGSPGASRTSPSQRDGRITLLPITRSSTNLGGGGEEKLRGRALTGQGMSSSSTADPTNAQQTSGAPRHASVPSKASAPASSSRQAMEMDHALATAAPPTFMSAINDDGLLGANMQCAGNRKLQEASPSSWQVEFLSSDLGSPRSSTSLRIVGRSHTTRSHNANRGSGDRPVSQDFAPVSTVKPGVWDQMLRDATQWLQGLPAHSIPTAVEQMRDWVQDQRWDWPAWWKHCASLLPAEWWDKLPQRAAETPEAQPTSPGLSSSVRGLRPEDSARRESSVSPRARKRSPQPGAQSTRNRKTSASSPPRAKTMPALAGSRDASMDAETDDIVEAAPGTAASTSSKREEAAHLRLQAQYSLAQTAVEGQLSITPGGQALEAAGGAEAAPHATVPTLAHSAATCGAAPALQSRGCPQYQAMDVGTLMTIASAPPAKSAAMPCTQPGIAGAPAYNLPCMHAPVASIAGQEPRGVEGTSMLPGTQYQPAPAPFANSGFGPQGAQAAGAANSGQRYPGLLPSQQQVLGAAPQQGAVFCTTPAQSDSEFFPPRQPGDTPLAGGSPNTTGTSFYSPEAGSTKSSWNAGGAAVSPDFYQPNSPEPTARALALLHNPALAPDEVTRQMVKEASIRFFNMRKATAEEKSAFVQDFIVRLELKKARIKRQAATSAPGEQVPGKAGARAASMEAVTTPVAAIPGGRAASMEAVKPPVVEAPCDRTPGPDQGSSAMTAPQAATLNAAGATVAEGGARGEAGGAVVAAAEPMPTPHGVSVAVPAGVTELDAGRVPVPAEVTAEATPGFLATTPVQPVVQGPASTAPPARSSTDGPGAAASSSGAASSHPAQAASAMLPAAALQQSGLDSSPEASPKTNKEKWKDAIAHCFFKSAVAAISKAKHSQPVGEAGMSSKDRSPSPGRGGETRRAGASVATLLRAAVAAAKEREAAERAANFSESSPTGPSS